VTKAYDRQHKDWEKNQNTTSRSHDDYDEVLRGYRTVDDTRSGIKTSVDLGNVDVIGDEMDPLPGR